MRRAEYTVKNSNGLSAIFDLTNMGIDRSYIKLVRSAVKNIGRTQVIEASIAFRETIKRSENIHYYSNDGLDITTRNELPGRELHGIRNPIYRDEQSKNASAPQTTLTYLEMLEKLSNQQRFEPVNISNGTVRIRNEKIDSNEFSHFPHALEAKRKEYYNRHLSGFYAPKGDWLDFKI